MIMRNTLAAIFSLFCLLAWPGYVAAHADLTNTDPANGATLEKTPEMVTLWFSAPLEPSFSKVQVVDKDGKQVDLGSASVDKNDPKVLRVGVPSLGGGSYKVIWSVVARDGHKLKGEYTFNVM